MYTPEGEHCNAIHYTELFTYSQDHSPTQCTGQFSESAAAPRTVCTMHGYDDGGGGDGFAWNDQVMVPFCTAAAMFWMETMVQMIVATMPKRHTEMSKMTDA